tara:strand:- start:1761 stop:2537 length:777 start_codon:yes stop_codon:yes gene_type:complete
LSSIYFGGSLFFLFILIVAILGSLEYRNIVRYGDDLSSKIMLIFFVSITIACYKIDFNFYQVLLVMISIMIIEFFNYKTKPLYSISTMLFGVIWLGLMFGSLIMLRDLEDIGFEIVVMLFVSVWACDSFAFVAGKYFGKKKILPSVSPKKTWLGTLFGVFGSTLSFYLFYSYSGNLGYNFLKINDLFHLNDIILIGIIIGIIGQFGDFFESLLKREAGIKDSSKILKGHGGILDRFDSIIFVSPSIYIYIELVINGRI